MIGTSLVILLSLAPFRHLFTKLEKSDARFTSFPTVISPSATQCLCYVCNLLLGFLPQLHRDMQKRKESRKWKIIGGNFIRGERGRRKRGKKSRLSRENWAFLLLLSFPPPTFTFPVAFSCRREIEKKFTQTEEPQE